MKTLPLFYFPTKQVWVDDDNLIIQALALAFNKEGQMIQCLSADAFNTWLAGYQSPIAKQRFLKTNMDDDNYGSPQQSPVNFNISEIAKLANNIEKYDEVSVAILDYKLPNSTGFELAQKLEGTKILKILLTGMAEQTQIISGFNDQLIDRFVPKDAPDLVPQLNKLVTELSFEHFRKITKPLAAHLETDQPLPFSDPVFIEFFLNLMQEKNVSEFYLVDKSGSLLCITATGERFYLAIHNQSSIKEWLAIYEEEEISQDCLDNIQAGKLLPFFGAGQEAWQIENIDWESYFYPSHTLATQRPVYWAIVHD